MNKKELEEQEILDAINETFCNGCDIDQCCFFCSNYQPNEEEVDTATCKLTGEIIFRCSDCKKFNLVILLEENS
jgi:hypothetical protein